MAEIGFISSIAGLLSLTIQVTAVSHRYFSNVKNASRTVKGYIRELEVFKLVLIDLEALAKDPSTRKQLLSVDSTIISGCYDELERFRSKLQKRTAGNVLSSAALRLTWPFAEEETRGLIDLLHRYQNSFHAALSAANMRVSTETLTAMKELHEDRIISQHSTVFNWLFSADPDLNHIAARKKHEPRTGDWLLKCTEFVSWQQSVSSVLWLHGKPGSGKTILASTIIEELKASKTIAPGNSALAYFYFDFSDDHKQTVESCLRTLLAQLCSSLNDIPDEIQRLSDLAQRGQDSLSSQILLTTLQRVAARFADVSIVLDALDESSQKWALLDVVGTLVNGDSNIRWVMTSRFEQDIVISFQELKIPAIAIEDAVVDEDIRLHIRSCLNKHQRIRRWGDLLMEEIEDALTERAGGM